MISSTANRSDYAGSSSQSAFTFPFALSTTTGTDLVFLETTAGVTTTKLLTTDYTLVMNQDVSTGGTVTRVAGNLPTGTALSIQRIVLEKQLSSFANQGSFYPLGYEQAIDYLTMVIQQMQDQLNRCLQYPQSEVTGTFVNVLPVATARASKTLKFDSSGNAITS